MLIAELSPEHSSAVLPLLPARLYHAFYCEQFYPWRKPVGVEPTRDTK